MKIIILFMFIFIPSCLNLSNENYGFEDLVFFSKGERIDIAKIEGVDLGSLYHDMQICPKNIGQKTYVTSQGIKLKENIIISWNYSSDRNEGVVTTTKINRIDSGVPEEIPEGYALNLVFYQGSWKINMSKSD